MATIAAVIQFDGRDNVGLDAIFNVAYTATDSTQQISIARVIGDLALPANAPKTWKGLIVQAIITDAAANGITVTAAQVQYISYEPGDYKTVEFAASWPKDITKTDIGSVLVNVYIGLNGEPQIVEMGPFSQYRLTVNGNKVGTGNLTHGLYELGAPANSLELTYTGAVGEFLSDSGWVNLPAWATGERILKPMALSSVATDDPIYRAFNLYLR